MKLQIAVCVSVLVGCAAPLPEEQTSSTSQGVWGNGDFEDDLIGTAPTGGWVRSTNLGSNLTDLRPAAQTLASLNLTTGGTQMTTIVGGPTETMTDPDVGTTGTLRYPKYGVRAVRLNYASPTANGDSKNSNTLKQTMTVSAGDVDPTDDKVHVRFALAPILENPNHAYIEQPYYFVRLQNVTKGTTVYSDFNASGQPGVPWKNFTDTTGSAAQYTDWQLVDISPGNAALAVGDQVELTVTTTGCSLGGHWGRVYLDAVGSGIPGLYSWGTGPQQANAGSNITYTLNYKNGGITTTSGTKVDFVTPPNTTYQSVSASGCTTPSVGGTGTVSCPIGTLSQGATGGFTVTVGVPAGTANATVITNGNYSIYATGVSALVGPKVQTTVTSGISYANLGITISDGIAAFAWGQSTQYTMTASNSGPLTTTGTVTLPVPTNAASVAWTCTASAGATCGASGTGAISDAVSLPVGGTATYTVGVTARSGTGSSTSVATATIAVGGGRTDPDSTDNTAVDTNSIGQLRTLTVTSSNPAEGSVVSSPSTINCGAACSGDFLDGTSIVLTATPVAGATFVGWSGACSGTTTTCTIAMTAAKAVTASFVGAPALATTTSSGGSQSTAVSTAFGAPLAVTVRDANGNPIPRLAVAFAGPGSGARATLSAASDITDTNGVADITATANGTPGTYAVTATIPGIASPISLTLTNIGPPASLTLVSGTPQSATVATSYADLAVLVRDAANLPLANITVSYAKPGSGASVSAAATTSTDASGIASLPAVANGIAGPFTVTATVAGVTPGVAFALTNSAGSPSAIVIVSGNSQQPTVGTQFGATLVARVTDALGNPIAGRTVSFTAPSNYVSLPAASAVTAANGEAVLARPTALTLPGTYAITAADGALGVDFDARNVAGAPASIVRVSSPTQSTPVTQLFATPLEVLVSDQYGNPTDANVAFTVPGSGASATVTSSVATLAGHASTIATANTTAGTYTATATVGALSTGFSLTNTVGAATTLAAISGSGQSPTVSTAFAQPLRVSVVDLYGNPVPSATVTFSTPTSGASAVVSSTTTDASGVAQITPTANTVAGGYTIAASVTGAVGASFTATNLAGAPASISATSGGGQSAVVTTRFAADIVATVLDAYGNPVTGATVSYVPAASPATATPDATSTTTSGSGVATMGITAGNKTGSHVMIAKVGTYTAAFSLDNTPGAATSIAVVSGTGQSAIVTQAFTAPLVARVLDAQANVVPGAIVSVAAPHASFAAAQVTTDGSGLASFSATADTLATSYTATATVASATATFAMTNTPGTVASIEIADGDAQEQTIGTVFARVLDVIVTDAHGNLVPAASVGFAPPPSGASATISAAAPTGADGHTTALATAGTIAGAYVVTATSGTGSADLHLTNLPGAGATIAVVGGDGQSAVVDTELPDSIEVLVRDLGGNPVPDAMVTFTAPPTLATASLSHAARSTDATGKARIRAVASQTTGTYHITAAIPASSVDATLTNLADVPASIAIANASSPQATLVTRAFARPLAVRVADRFDNPVPSTSVSLEVPAGGASVLVASAMTTGDDGIATAPATANTVAGSYVVLARVTDIAQAAVFSLTNRAGAPADLAMAAGDGQSTIVNTTFAVPLAALVRDANGNPVPGATVHFSAPTTGGSAQLSASAALSDGDGIAQITATANTVAANYDVIATLDGAAAPVAFPLTNRAGTPAMLTVDAAATPQTARVTTELARPLGVTVTDAFGNGVPAVTVTYSAPATGASAMLSSPTAITGATGKAAIAATAGTTTGAYAVVASIPGGLSGQFAVANLQGDPSRVAAVGGDDQRATVDSEFDEPLVVEVRDAFGNIVVGAPVAFTVPGTGPTAIPSSPTATTDAAGRASITVKASTTTGAYAATASVSDGAAPTTFALENTADAPSAVVADVEASAQTTEVGHAFAKPLAVTVRDRFGNRVPRANVTYTGPSNYVALSQTTTRTDANGRAEVIAIASNTAMAYEATAAVAGIPVATFVLENTASAPGGIVLVSGGGQHARATTAFTEPVVALVVDAFGNPVAGADVDAAMPAAGASAVLVAAMEKSDAQGLVRARLTANGVVGSFSLSLRARGALSPLVVPLVVDAIPTTTTAEAAAVSVDQPLEIDVQVAAALGTATGDVELVDGDVVVAAATLVGGSATLTTIAPQPGTRTYQVRYRAQSSFGASASTSLTVEIGEDSGTLSGSGGCNTSGGSASWLVILAALALVRRRSALLAALVAIIVPNVALAEPAPSTRAIDRLHSAAADSEWFAVDSLGFEGHHEVSLEVLNDYANRPLVAYDGDGNERGVIVSRSYVMQVGASVSLANRFRLSATVPFSTYQTGNDTMFNGVMLRAPVFAFGDVSVAGDARLAGDANSALRIAAGIRLGLPTGSTTNYMSDGVFSIEPRVMVAGGRDRFEYAAVASIVMRGETEMAGQSFGGELRAAIAAGVWLADRKLLVGPELVTARSLQTGTATGNPAEIALGVGYQFHDAWRLRLGASMGMNNAVGVPDQRALLSLTWLHR